MKKRAASEEEKILFKKTVEQARPRIASKTAGKKLSGNAKPGIGALDGTTARKLKQGALQPAARLDLHGLTQDAAHRALLSFLRSSHKNGLRLALVITGMGSKSEGGVLKEMVPRWLGQPAFAAFITGIAPAHVRHGGAGALYVYLRK